jgi:glycosyltransferase involved in cell wall biosynthesis
MTNNIRILSLITHFSHLAQWEANTTRVNLIDPIWQKRSRLSKVWKLLQLAPEYDCILFFYDVRLLVIFWLFYYVRYQTNPSDRMFFTTFLCDVSSFAKFSYLSKNWIREKLRFIFYFAFTRMVKIIVVHSSTEIDLYANTFHLHRNHFEFIPYFVRRDALSFKHQTMALPAAQYILAAGRSRDFHTFIAALRDTPFHGVIIGGQEDKDVFLQEDLPPNVDAYFEIPFQQYRAWIAGAKVFVVPLFADRVIRSLGQIATFEAIANHIPVIASRTFQLSDYFIDGIEILFYQAENSNELRKQIERIMGEQLLGKQLAKRAYSRMLTQYTDEQYTKSLLQLLCR